MLNSRPCLLCRSICSRDFRPCSLSMFAPSPFYRQNHITHKHCHKTTNPRDSRHKTTVEDSLRRNAELQLPAEKTTVIHQRICSRLGAEVGRESEISPTPSFRLQIASRRDLETNKAGKETALMHLGDVMLKRRKAFLT